MEIEVYAYYGYVAFICPWNHILYVLFKQSIWTASLSMFFFQFVGACVLSSS